MTRAINTGIRPSTKIVLLTVLVIGMLWGLAFAFTGNHGDSAAAGRPGTHIKAVRIFDDADDEGC